MSGELILVSLFGGGYLLPSIITFFGPNFLNTFTKTYEDPTQNYDNDIDVCRNGIFMAPILNWVLAVQVVYLFVKYGVVRGGVSTTLKNILGL